MMAVQQAHSAVSGNSDGSASGGLSNPTVNNTLAAVAHDNSNVTNTGEDRCSPMDFSDEDTVTIIY